jgi:uncharacterized OsmC-like protein
MDPIGVTDQVPSVDAFRRPPASQRADAGDRTIPAPTYRVHGLSRPGGHAKIRCNTTEIKADTGSISDGFRPGPAELLCAALAACLLKNIERYSELLPFQYATAAVEVEAVRQDAPPRMTRMRYLIEIVTDEPEHRVDLLHANILKYGTITNTLAASCELTGEMIARRSGERGHRS